MFAVGALGFILGTTFGFVICSLMVSPVNKAAEDEEQMKYLSKCEDNENVH